MLTVAAVGLTCKAFLRSGLCSLDLAGLHHLQAALEEQPRRGVVTGTSLRKSRIPPR